jgi:hypothetical protein
MSKLLDTLHTQHGTTGNTTLTWSTHFKVRRCTHNWVLSSLVLSRQRIYNRLTVNWDHTWSLLFAAQFFSCPYCGLNSIHLLPSSYPGRLASRNSTLPSMLINWILLDNHFERTPRKIPSSIVPFCFRHVYGTIAYQRSRLGQHGKQPLLYWGVFTSGTCLLVVA